MDFREGEGKRDGGKVGLELDVREERWLDVLLRLCKLLGVGNFRDSGRLQNCRTCVSHTARCATLPSCFDPGCFRPQAAFGARTNITRVGTSPFSRHLSLSSWRGQSRQSTARGRRGEETRLVFARLRSAPALRLASSLPLPLLLVDTSPLSKGLRFVPASFSSAAA